MKISSALLLLIIEAWQVDFRVDNSDVEVLSFMKEHDVKMSPF